MYEAARRAFLNEGRPQQFWNGGSYPSSLLGKVASRHSGDPHLGTISYFRVQKGRAFALELAGSQTQQKLIARRRLPAQRAQLSEQASQLAPPVGMLLGPSPGALGQHV